MTASECKVHRMLTSVVGERGGGGETSLYRSDRRHYVGGGGKTGRECGGGGGGYTLASEPMLGNAQR
jgi:hypothetical protein